MHIKPVTEGNELFYTNIRTSIHQSTYLAKSDGGIGVYPGCHRVGLGAGHQLVTGLSG